MIADMAIQLEAARCAALRMHRRQVDMGDFSQLSMMASMAKCFGSDVAMKVTTDAVQIFGGVGYMRDLSGRADDARREDQPDLGRHQPDPAHRDLAPFAREGSLMSKLKISFATRSTMSRTARPSASAAGFSIRSRWRWCAG